MIKITHWGLLFLGLSMILTAIIISLIPREKIEIENVNLYLEKDKIRMIDGDHLAEEAPTIEELQNLFYNPNK